MPCFDSGPAPGTPEYARWLPDVSRRLDSFVHIVDYYYGKAGLPVPEPGNPEDARGYPSAAEMARDAVRPIDPQENARVLQQILLHLDCDGVDMFVLNDVRNLVYGDPTSRGHGYAAVLNHCFGAMRLGFSGRPANDAQWRASRDPVLMLDAFECRPSDRKLRLFAAACCRRLPHVMADARCRRAVEAAERFADGQAPAEELGAAFEGTAGVTNRHGTYSPASHAASAEAGSAARMAALFAAVDSDAGREEEARVQADLLHCILGNPFRPAAFAPEWRSDTAVALAHQMYDSCDFGAMPILADALQDAGCANSDVLDHCRDAAGHVRGCWVVDLVLGKC